MYSNPAQWRRLRTRVLVNGESIRSVAKREGMSRNTLKRLLALDRPPTYRRANMLTKAPAAAEGSTPSRPTFPGQPRAPPSDNWMELQASAPSPAKFRTHESFSSNILEIRN